MFHRVLSPYTATNPATSNRASENRVAIPSQPFAWEALWIRVKIEDDAIFKSLRSLSNDNLRARVNNAFQSDPKSSAYTHQRSKTFCQAKTSNSILGSGGGWDLGIMLRHGKIAGRPGSKHLFGCSSRRGDSLGPGFYNNGEGYTGGKLNPISACGTCLLWWGEIQIYLVDACSRRDRGIWADAVARNRLDLLTRYG